MALIPPDAGIRMRMQTEASLVQPLGPVKEIPSDLPELQVGQTFFARIQEGLPENTYRALVAGKMLTLQLPEGAKPGDTMELVLIDRTPKLLVAQRVEGQPAAAGAAEPYPYAILSRSGQLIAQLLTPEGEAPPPAALNRGQPLLAQPPASAAELVPTLAKAVGESGLFYEAHQAQWIAGRRPLESLHAEPQGRVAMADARPAAASAQAASQAAAGPALATGAERAQEGSAATLAQAVPDELRPLVQQQLDAVATQRLAWHGEVWPGQVMEWEIERERTEDRQSAAAAEESERWSTSLRLVLPRLGAVNATLQLAGPGLRLRLATDDETAASDLRGGLPQLARALETAGIPLQSVEVQRGGPE